MPEEIINRHQFGALIIYLSGVVTMSVLLYVVLFAPLPDRMTNVLLGVIAALTGIVTLVGVWVYNGTYMRLNESGINIVKAISLFGGQSPETDWDTVQGTNVKTSILYKLFGFGTLIVQTSDGHEDLTMTYVPNIDAVRKYVDENAKAGAGGV